jgi:long-subunit fatty acid transport protein
MVLSYAGNYNDKLMIGLTVGIPFSKHTFESTYAEEDKTNSIKFFNKLDYNNSISTEGAGINLKAGAIYRPTQSVRIGAAIHTPTAFDFKETYNADMFYSFTSSSNIVRENSAESPIGEVEYKVISPWKFIGSAGVIVGKYGFISADAEYLNYASAKIRFDTPDSIGVTRINELKGFEADLDKEIKAQFKSAVNFRLGGEVALDAFRFRVGYNYLGAARQTDSPRNVFTLGAGVRGQNVYFDVAFRSEKQKFDYRRYEAGDESRQPTVNVNYRQNAIITTIGFKF